MNAWKDGRARDALTSVDEHGTEVRGLPWRHEVSTDVFECASVNAAQALANWSKSRTSQRTGQRTGQRAGKAAGFPRFKSRHKTAPAFRLRARYTEGKASPVRPAGPRIIRFPKLGELRVHEHTGRLTKMLAAGRFHVYAASFRLELANQALARTKRDSNGRKKAARRLGRIHARVAHLRRNLLQQITTELARGYTSVTIEDLNAAGMLTNRRLVRVVSDSAFGELRRQLAYKAAWYGTELVVADRWFPSSKTCSDCGAIDACLTLSDRVYECASCGLSLDRDVNAAINLARYSGPPPKTAPPRPVAA